MQKEQGVEKAAEAKVEEAAVEETAINLKKLKFKEIIMSITNEQLIEHISSMSVLDCC